ncbi:MAG: hypothetical protein V2B18_02980, partial [Pseudomonadota bacterium]
MKRLRNLLDVPNGPFKPIHTPDQTENYLGEDRERAFAEQQGLYYLNEHSDESDRIDKEFGLLQLGDHLSLAGDLSRQQQKQLDRLAAKKKGCPLPRNKEAVGGIVADMMTLLTLEEAGLLKPVMSHFEEIYFSEGGRQRLVAGLARFEFAEEIADRFRRFERYLKGLGTKLEYVPVSDERRKAVSLTFEKAPPQREAYGEWGYILDLFLVATEKGCCLVTDDRVTRRLRFSEKEDFSSSVPRVGSDALLRFFFRSGALSIDDYADIYGKLMEWRYLHMPPESDYILTLLPTVDDKAPGRLQRVLGYYQESVSLFMRLAKSDPSAIRRRLPQFLATHNRQLGSTLRKAFELGISSEQAAHVVKGLALNFYLDEFKGRIPEYLTGFIPLLTRLEGRSLDKTLDTEGKFQLWLDQALQMAGISPRDIDVYWQAYFGHLLASKRRAPNPQEIQAVLGLSWKIMPPHRRQPLALSSVGKDLQREGVLEIIPGPVYTFPMPGAEATEAVMVSDKEIEAALEQLLTTGITDGSETATVGRLRIQTKREGKDGLFVDLTVRPVLEGFKDDDIASISRVIGIFGLLAHPNGKLREEAWTTSRLKLLRLGLDVERWDSLKESLLAGEEPIWRLAADECASTLLSNSTIACEIAVGCLTKNPGWFFGVLSKLRPEHVKRWLAYSGNELTHEAHLTEAAWEEAFREPKDLAAWTTERRLVYHSMFSDAKAARARFVRKVFEELGGQVPLIIKLAHDLVGEGEKEPSPVYKANVALTILEIANFKRIGATDRKETGLSQMEFWRSTSDPDSSLELRQRVERLLTNAFGSWTTLIDDPDKETEHLPVHAEMSQLISRIWSIEAPDSNLLVRRFLSVIAGGLFTSHLGSLAQTTSVHGWRESRSRIRKIGRWLPGIDGSQGFFRPDLWDYLRYHVCFAVKGLRPFTSTVAGYLMSDSLRTRLLECGSSHKYACVALGGADTLQPGTLDESFDTSDTGGIDGFLEQCAGDSIKYWSARDTEKLSLLSKPTDLDKDLKGVFRTIGKGINKPDTDELVFWMMTLELGLRSKRKGWATSLTRLLERRVRELIEQSAELYERLLKYAFVVLVESGVSQTAKNRFKHFLFSSPYSLHKSNKLRSHLEAVLALLRTGRNSEEACEWIERLAMSKSIDFRTRRDLVGEVVDAYDDLPIA